MSRIIGVIFVLVSFFYPATLNATMSGGDYQIYADNVGVNDSSPGTSASFSLTDTIAEPFATTTSDATFTLRGGFQAAEQGVLSFSLSTTSVSLGTLSTTSIATAIVTTTISTDSETGYTLSVTEDGNLRTGANDVDDVVDGSVTAGSEEYGILTTGGDGILGSDTAISGSVAVASAAGAVTSRSTPIQFRASVSNSTIAGSYSHIVTFTATVNP